ncbi:hypothetical protein ACQEVF_48500 [Nonomuraea polychroma]|uniref:hypothetical protein n=1 Tax=Nonomuraea polychroma TaxID=46176 RepID=UPI003D907CCD
MDSRESNPPAPSPACGDAKQVYRSRRDATRQAGHPIPALRAVAHRPDSTWSAAHKRTRKREVGQ